MEKIQLSALEKEMANFNFDELATHSENAKEIIANAQTASDVKSQICLVWSKISKFVKPLELLPIVGKFVKILADLLDTLCA